MRRDEQWPLFCGQCPGPAPAPAPGPALHPLSPASHAETQHSEQGKVERTLREHFHSH